MLRGARTSAERHRKALTQPLAVPPSPWISRDRDSSKERMEAEMGVGWGGAEKGLCSPHLFHTVQTHSRSSIIFYQRMGGWMDGWMVRT